MATAITIPKNKSSFPEHIDFYKLRELGLEHIQKLGSEIWTDYNLHDPGITILEVLCYAITDLGYRANFDIKDILTRSLQEKNNTEKDIFGRPYDSNFYTAAQILGCNPVTVTDYRKLFIDIPGVRNAWLEKADGQEVKIALDCKNKKLDFWNNSYEKELKLNGLYDIIIEIEPQFIIDACGKTVESREGIIKRVYEVFHSHRNLCEDVRGVSIYGEEEIGICADVELTEDANPDEVMLQISLAVEEYLSPTLVFHTLQEMLSRGRTVDEIFEGRPLTKDSRVEDSENSSCLSLIPGRGFIDIDELETLNPKENLHVSDIHKTIMDVPGVLAIHNLVLVNYVNNLPQTTGEKWCIKLTKGYRPHMGLDKAKINFRKGPLYFSYEKDTVKQRFAEEKLVKSKACLEPYQLDLPVPEGTFHDFSDYTSIMHEFPVTYGIGEDGINQKPTIERKAQAKQLQAFLLFFDQLLANYLSQLSHVRDIFSMRTDEFSQRLYKARTYFYNVLNDIPGGAELIKNEPACNNKCSGEAIPEDYPGFLAHLVENDSAYYKRRSRVLDHLLARFSESFSEYVTQIYKLQKEFRSDKSIIDNKSKFLENYPEISRNRGKGFDVLSDAWEIDNVSGLKKRVANLLGIKGIVNNRLSRGDILDVSNNFKTKIVYEKIKLLTIRNFSTSAEADAFGERLIQNLRNLNQVHIFKYSISELPGFYYVITNEFGKNLARSYHKFATTTKLNDEVDELIALFDSGNVKIIYPDELSSYYFQVTDAAGNIFLESTEIFTRNQEAQEVIEELTALATNKENYFREDTILENVEEFKFVILSDSLPKEILAESAPFETEDDCLEGLHTLINYLRLDEIEPEIVRDEESFEYWLYNALKNKIIFKSDEGYESESDAEEAFSVFRSAASEIESYQDLSIGDRFSFCLKNTNTDEIIGRHLFNYETEQERDDRKWAIKYYIDEKPIDSPQIGGIPGNFILQVKDEQGKVVLISPPEGSETGYRTQALAKRIHEKVRKSASDESMRFYVLLDNYSQDFPYSFSLNDRNGDVLANHPLGYATQEERDRAIEVLMYGIQNQVVNYDISEHEDGFYFEMKKMNHDSLMIGTLAYETKEDCEEAWNTFLYRADSWSHYNLINALDNVENAIRFEIFVGENDEYYFHLKARNGEIILQSEGYKTKQGCENGIRSVRENAKDKENFERLKSDDNQDYFVLKAQNHKIIGVSEMYTSKGGMENGIRSVMVNSQITEVNDTTVISEELPYSFSLKAANGQVIAYHNKAYASVAERDLALQSVINYVSFTNYSESFSGTPGSYTFLLMGKNEEVLLESFGTFDDEATAIGAYNELLRYGTERSNYFYNTDNFGFVVRNDENEIIARPPETYVFANASERDAAIEMLLAYLRNDIVQYTIENVGGAFYSLVSDSVNDILLKGDIMSPSKHKGIIELHKLVGAKEPIAFPGYATNPDYYSIDILNTTCAYSFFVSDEQGNRIASHPSRYHSLEEMNASRLYTLSWISDYKKLKGNIIAERVWQKLIDWNNETLLLVDSEFVSTEGILAFIDEGSNELRYQIVPKQGLYQVFLKSFAGEIIGKHPLFFHSEYDAKQVIKRNVDFLMNQGLWVADAGGVNLFDLRNSSGEILLQIDTTKKTILEIIGLARLADYYVRFEKDTPIVADEGDGGVPPEPMKEYGFHLVFNESIVLATHPLLYKTEGERDAALTSLIDFIAVNHTEERMQETQSSFYYKLTDFSNNILLSSKNKREYSSYSEANTLYDSNISLALDRENYSSTIRYLSMSGSANNCAYSFTVNQQIGDETEIVFTHGNEYNCIDKRNGEIDKILLLLKEKKPKTVVAGVTNGFTFSLEHTINNTANEKSLELENDEKEKQNEQIQFVLEGALHYPSAGEARKMLSQTLEYLKSSDYYFVASELNGNAQIQIKKNNTILAHIHSTVETQVLINVLVNFFNANEGELLVEIDEVGPAKKFMLGFDNVELLEGNVFQWVKDLEGNVIKVREEEEMKELSCELNNEIVVVGQDDRYYRYIESTTKCLYGFEIFDRVGGKIANHFYVYNELESRSSTISALKDELNGEGMHVFEHILLRPRHTTPPAEYHYAIEVLGEILFRGIPETNVADDSIENAVQNFKSVLNLFIPNDFKLKEKIKDLPDEKTQYYFVLELDDEVAGQSELFYCDQSLAGDDMDAVQSAMFELKLQIANLEDEEIVEILQPFIVSRRSMSELQGESFLPVPLLCSEESNVDCTAMSDPYSFRLTVVLPFWPERFNNPEFRDYLETSIRKETPSHLFPRICWLDACQMRELENYYKDWLATMSIKNDHCNAVHARRNLVQILSNLKSKYPDVQLYDCEQENSDKNKVILDHSRLG